MYGSSSAQFEGDQMGYSPFLPISESRVDSITLLWPLLTPNIVITEKSRRPGLSIISGEPSFSLSESEVT